METIIESLTNQLRIRAKAEALTFTIQQCYIYTAYIRIVIQQNLNKFDDETCLIAQSITDSLSTIFQDQIKDVPREVLKAKAVDILSYQEMKTFIQSMFQFRLILALLNDFAIPQTRNQQTQETLTKKETNKLTTVPKTLLTKLLKPKAQKQVNKEQ